ncbi:MAG: SRPBCC family protein [Rhizobium sp.]
MSAELDPARILRVERLVSAPRALVFEAFSNAKHLDAWWGPDGFTNETHEMEFAVGGLWRYTMHGPDGKDWPNWIRYREISPPLRLVYDHGEEIGEPAHFEGVISFEAEGDKTRVTLTLVFPTPEARDATLKFGAIEGGHQTLAKLDAYLAKLQAG